MTQPKLTPEQHFAAALAKVESKSIRAWAQTDHNRPIWLKIAESAIQKHGDAANSDEFATYIVLTALG